MRQPSPSRVAVVVGVSRLGAVLDERGGEQHVAARRPWRGSPAARRSRTARSAARRDTSVGITGSGDDVAADLAQHHAEVEEAEAEAAGRLRQRDAEQVRLRELAATWRGRTSRRSGRAPSGAGGPCGPRGCGPRGRAAPLGLGEGEVHRACSSGSVDQRGLPGMLSPKIEIRSRCISLVPPPNVRMCIDAQHALDPAAQHRAGRVALQRRLVAHDLHQQARGFHVELGAVHLDRRRVGRVQRARRSARATRPASSRASGTRAWRARGRG